MNRARCNSNGPVTVADLIVTRIARHSSHLFGVGGANIEDIYDAVERGPSGFTGVVAKHEFGAATMADGYARTTNRLGVVAATSGGGALNLLAGLGESFDSRVPVLALVGQPPTTLEGRGAFQDTSGAPGRLDAERLFGAVARHCERVSDPTNTVAALDRAIDSAYGGGPAVLLLPKDIQTATAAPESPVPERERPVDSPLIATLDTALALSDSVVAAAHHPPTIDHAAVTLLREASGRTVIIAGPEIARANTRAELKIFAEALGAPVLVTPDARDTFPNTHSGFAGVVGIMGHRNAPDLLAAAEVVVLVGTTLPLTARAGLDAILPQARVLHLGMESPFVHTDFQLRAPLARTLTDLAARVGTGHSDSASTGASAVPKRAEDAGGGAHPAAIDAHRRPVELDVPPAAGPGIRYREAVSAIAKWLAPGTDVVVDAGNTGAAVVHYLPVAEDGRFVIALGMGGMGYAFGAGVGSALGRRRRTCVIAGDGAYLMHGHEVHTAVEYHVPVTFVVFNNNAHAMCVTREQLYFSGEYTFNRFAPAQLGAGVAATYPSLPTCIATTLAELKDALDRTREASGPVFLEVVCDPDEIPPFAPFLKELTA
ncbi:thiamine pyrophosphate-binding protein [Nocardia sp. NPDC050406]|uniref:thiamine pyrophosphate-binding protein n=1 Tax=Nocardia sp. NPDC050406 TaxID=3364318 RepID=UPI0037B69047